MSEIAVLDTTQPSLALRFQSGSARLCPFDPSARDIASILSGPSDIAQLWVFGPWSDDLESAFAEFWQTTDEASDHWRPMRARSAPSRRLTVVLPRADLATSCWASASSPEVLLQAVTLYEETMGIRYRRSPAGSAANLLRSLHRDGKGRQLQTATLPPPALVNRTEWDTKWIRPEARELLEAAGPWGWVHSYDCSAAYLAAASSLRLGVGEVRHLVQPDELREFFADICASGKVPPGYYRLTTFGHTDRNQPIPWRSEDGLPAAWLTAPIAELLTREFTGLTLWEAYVWPESARPLESWYRVCRDALRQLETLRATGEPVRAEAAAIARKAVKLGYGPFLGGWVASRAWEREGDPLYRPDWRHHVMAQVRANQHRALARLELARSWDTARQESPVLLAVSTDCLYFLSPCSDPLQAMPMDLRAGTTPGLYKVQDGGIPASAVLEAMTPGRKPLGAVETVCRQWRSAPPPDPSPAESERVTAN